MKVPGLLVLVCAASLFANAASQGNNSSLPPAQVPAKTLPVPGDVSPEMQKIIAAPRNPNWNVLWKTGEEWRAAANTQAAKTMQTLPASRERLHVTTKPGTMGGVRIFTVSSDSIPHEHRDKLLIHVHGGCYVMFPGESGTGEAILMAGLGHFKVVSVDYRMPPEGYFPAALDDAMTVYKEALKTYDPKNIAVFGTSAGGALVLEMMLRAKQMGLPMPGAIAPGTPMSDVTKTGDTFYTNEMVDNVLVSRDGFCDAATVVYAHGHDLKDPLLSPVYGDMHGFPPAILTTGTRDLLLSNTVRVHRKLREAGIDAQLEVFEGQSHAQYQFDDRAPETKAAFGEITAFFDTHLGHLSDR
ncbi:alpha/beta hydrolase [Edaphobacter modestus]|uniref:Acetyl esterase/lipase n=1 Tax=Edaphobacter modestus TaxID=388466 RepID=A0A4Q7YUQ1_9BACT|nr:alpha/beta hydrolase [Edaphobacter modestus]RZU41602.1 acetyl esterase/lipase [Edaphobacter modestus]